MINPHVMSKFATKTECMIARELWFEERIKTLEKALNPPTIEAARKMGEKGGPVVEAERLAFEAWMAGHCWDLSAEWNGVTYMGAGENLHRLDPHAVRIRQLWAAWRDRAALLTQPERN